MANSYIKNLLGKNEEILMITHQHWLILARDILLEVVTIIGIILLTSFAWLVWVGNPLMALAYLFLLIPIGSLIRDALAWSNHQYIVTNRRVVQVFGILSKNVTDSSLEKVNDVKMVQSFWGRLLNYGNIEILTASEMGINRFTRIDKPIEFKTAMVNAKEEMKSDILEEVEDGQNQVTSAIKQLQSMLKQGTITSEEFEKIKANMLKNL